MKRFLALLCTLVLLHMPAAGYAGPREDYEEAYKLYITAGASVAAYSGRIGELATRYLEQDGWQMDYYVQPQGHTGARFLVAKKDLNTGIPLYMVAIVGTETNGDIKTDLQVDKVAFADSNAEELAANDTKKEIAGTDPKVHRGFYEFVQAGPSAVLRNAHHAPFNLSQLLSADQNYKLYLTGHSLGGAAATLAGARLLNSGINPDQIEVITFGAPAVGNKAFAAKFEPTLNLTRIVHSGDPVTGVLQTLVGGYQQFGREIKWNPPATVDDPHKLTGYVDSVMKNYYDKRFQAVQAGMELPAPAVVKPTNPGRVYIAPLQNNLPSDLTAEFWYMKEALQEEYRQTLPDHVTAEAQPNAIWREPALVSGCRWAIVSEVGAIRVKQEEKNTYCITVTQTVYDVATGAVADTATFSTGTYNLTPLEAFIHAFKGMSIHQDSWIMNNELVQLKLNIETSVRDSTPTEATESAPTYGNGGVTIR